MAGLMKEVKARLVGLTSPEMIAGRIAQLEEERSSTEAELRELRGQLGEILVDRPDDAASHRGRIRTLEERIEEVDAMLQTLLRRRVEAEQREQDNARQKDIDRWRVLGAATERLELEYSKAAEALAGVLRQLSEIDAEAHTIEGRFENAGRKEELFTAAARRPGRTLRGAELFNDQHLTRIPRLEDGQGAYYSVNAARERET